MQTERLNRKYLLFVIGTLIWGITVLWVNFHGAQWYNFDMFADASVAKRMAEQHTLFPKDWLFGNQYYIIATPVLAALFNGIFHNSVFSMACASSLMFLLILLCYTWSFRPILSKPALMAGLFCMAGATILGDSISSSTYGFQILYTMASYYACYLLVILLHLGIWVRFEKAMPVSPLLIVSALTASFALGVQSQREMLALCIPLLLITLILWLRNRTDPGEKKGFVFAAASLGSNLIGLLCNGYIKQHQGSQYLSNVSSVDDAASGALGTRIMESGKAFLDLVGLRYLQYSWKWKLLAVLGVFLLILALLALVVCLKKKDRMGSRMLLFCWISLFGVFMAGVLVVQVRAIYYFVWYLLLPLSIALLLEHLTGRKKPLLCAAVLLCGAVSFFFNVYPDAAKYQAQKLFYSEIVSWLEENGITTIYGDYQTPTIAACSGDRITFCSVFPNKGADSDEQSRLLIPYGSPVATERYRDVSPEQSVLILSDSPYDELSGYRYLQNYMGEAYQSRFETCFSQEACFESPQVTYYIYSFSDPEIIA